VLSWANRYATTWLGRRDGPLAIPLHPLECVSGAPLSSVKRLIPCVSSACLITASSEVKSKSPGERRASTAKASQKINRRLYGEHEEEAKAPRVLQHCPVLVSSIADIAQFVYGAPRTMGWPRLDEPRTWVYELDRSRKGSTDDLVTLIIILGW